MEKKRTGMQVKVAEEGGGNNDNKEQDEEVGVVFL